MKEKRRKVTRLWSVRHPSVSAPIVGADLGVGFREVTTTRAKLPNNTSTSTGPVWAVSLILDDG
jgi:hypothetical protein